VFFISVNLLNKFITARCLLGSKEPGVGSKFNTKLIVLYISPTSLFGLTPTLLNTQQLGCLIYYFVFVAIRIMGSK
jgi:hypothetical protein